MAPAALELTIMAAEDLKNVSTFGKMDLYAVAWVERSMKRSTRVVHKAGRSPVWNDTVTLPLGNYIQYYPASYLTVEIFSEANWGDKLVGVARLSLQEIYRLTSISAEPALVTLQLQRPSGRAQGVVRLSMKVVGDAGSQGRGGAMVPALNNSVDKSMEPVMGIPVGDPYSVTPTYYEAHRNGATATGYPSISADSSHSGSGSSGSSGSSGIIPYAYPPAYQGYSSAFPYPAPPNQTTMYQQVPYSYVQPPRAERSNGGGLLLGLLGGALGGLILGDILT